MFTIFLFPDIPPPPQDEDTIIVVVADERALKELTFSILLFQLNLVFAKLLVCGSYWCNTSGNACR